MSVPESFHEPSHSYSQQVVFGKVLEGIEIVHAIGSCEWSCIRLSRTKSGYLQKMFPKAHPTVLSKTSSLLIQERYFTPSPTPLGSTNRQYHSSKLCLRRMQKANRYLFTLIYNQLISVHNEHLANKLRLLVNRIPRSAQRHRWPNMSPRPLSRPLLLRSRLQTLILTLATLPSHTPLGQPYLH
jgi:hypothetical protein